MEMLFAVIPAILIPLAVSAVLPWMYARSKKEEEQDGVIAKTSFPRRFTLCSVITLSIFVILFLISTVLLCFETDLPLHSWVAFIIASLFLISLPLLLTLLSLRTYEVIREDGILVARLFKKRLVAYSEMYTYHCSFDQITVFDCEHKVIFYVSDNRVGTKALLDQLECNGIFRE